MTEPANETFTYGDGSQVVGSPPFPVLSPLERARGDAEPEAVTGNTITADDLQGGPEPKATKKAKK